MILGDFTYATAGIIIMLLSAYFARRNTRQRSGFYFLFCVITLSIVNLLNEVIAKISQDGDNFDRGALTTSVCLSMFFFCAFYFGIVFYFFEILGVRKIATSVKIILIVFATFEIIGISITPQTGFFFTLDKGIVYVTAIFFIYFSIVLTCFNFTVITYIAKYGQNIRKYQRYSLFAACVTLVFAFVGQAVFPRYQPGCMISALALILLFSSIEDASEFYYQYNLCFNEYAFKQIASRNFRHYNLEGIVFVGIVDFTMMSLYLQRDMIERLENRLVEGMVKGFGKKNVFYFDNGNFAIAVSKMKENEADSIYEKVCEICSGVGAMLPLEPFISILRKEDIETGEDCVTASELFKMHDPGADSGKRVFELKKEDFRLHRRERAVLTAITDGINNNHFVVCYQPIYDVSLDVYSSCEVLMRLNDPKLGMLFPDEFIPVADKYGLSGQIGDRVFELVCKTLKRHNLKDLGTVFMHINISQSQCIGNRLSESMGAICRKYEIDPRVFGIEISENSCIKDKGTILENVLSLKRKGMSFAIDNFGCVFSSADKITGFPVKYIKFDRHTIAGSISGTGNKAILMHLVKMIKELGYKAVACGVETDELYRSLYSMGFDLFQGYYFSKPLYEEEYIKFLNDHVKR
ncbi:MAG: EAL domain-containing protein [Lachnospiraceae bacterium]|nr:EAL domain-containing protein [Lachnospiraceae bacterium]